MVYTKVDGFLSGPASWPFHSHGERQLGTKEPDVFDFAVHPFGCAYPGEAIDKSMDLTDQNFRLTKDLSELGIFHNYKTL